MFWEVNEDEYSGDPATIATGPRVGFLDAFETSYNTQVRTSAMFGIEKAFHERENDQVQALRAAGAEDVPLLSDNAFGFFGLGAFSGDYEDVARFYEDGGDVKLGERLAEYDTKIAEYQKRYPNLQLQTSREMWDEIRAVGREYDRRSQTERTTWGGAAGSFLGGAVGGLNLEADPLNFATMPLAPGKSVVGRIVGQGAAQGIVEGINQITGVQEQRRLLGLDHGFADGLWRVGTAATGGAVLQGFGEGLAAGARRFFSDPPPNVLPDPPRQRQKVALQEVGIPPDLDIAAEKLIQQPQTYMEYLQEVSPLSTTRAGRARTVIDVDNVSKQLGDWAGPDPVAMLPKSDTAISLPRNDFTASQPNIFDRVAETPNLDALAREVDPDTFRVYDKLADENTTYRRWLDELQPTREQNAEVRRLADEITALKAKQDSTGKMKAKKIAKQIEAKQTEYEAAKAQALATDTPDMARVRSKLMRNDERMRDMAPVVSRAYTRAQNKWDASAQEHLAVRQMIAEGRKTLGNTPQVDSAVAALPKTLYDKAPILQQRARVESKLKGDPDAADIAAAVYQKNREDMEPVLENFRAEVTRIAKEAEAAKEKTEKKVKPPKPKPGEPEPLPPNKILIPGYKEPLDLKTDKVIIVDEDGTERSVSLEELFTRQNEVEEDAKAVQSCSIQ